LIDFLNKLSPFLINLEELLDIVKDTDASEVVFVLPKQARAFKSEGHFVVLADEAKDLNKSISFLCLNPEVNELAKKYKFDVLSIKTESAKPRVAKPKFVAVKDDDVSFFQDFSGGVQLG